MVAPSRSLRDTGAMSKPSYLGLLNAVAVAETAAEPIFTTWADTTKDKKLAKALRFVGMREGEHGKAFAKRMLELGYEVRQPSTAGASESVAIAGSTKTDLQKFRALKLGNGPAATDVFDGMFADKNIDPVTGGLLGRYIAEERDSARLLAAEHDRLAAKEKLAKERAKAKKSVKK
jgi:hypothetical protein